MKILNLFAGIGGNRTLWGDSHEITAVEYDPNIANIYKERFPNDTVIIYDAYRFLEEHFREYDFIWASPPCPTHSKMNSLNKNSRKLPDMRLYGFIIFLQSWFKGKFVIENVKPYYKPLLTPSVELSRHYFWTNFYIKPKEFKFNLDIRIHKNGQSYPHSKDWTQLCEEYGIEKEIIKSVDKRTVVRNCVPPEVGKYILDQVGKKTIQQTLPWRAEP